MNPRTSAAVAAGKIAGAVSRISRLGGGTAVAGLAAERIDHDIVSNLVGQAGEGAIAVTGTNGKTTTSLMLSRIASGSALRPLHNRSGSNLMRGVAAMLVEESTFAGAIPDAKRRLAILEVDEATLPAIVRAAAPRAIVFTNLFRDQLDRYGEVDTVAKAWERALAPATRDDRQQTTDNRQQTPTNTRQTATNTRQTAPGTRGAPLLVLNADDPGVAHLGRGVPRERVLYYGIEDTSAGIESDEHASDFRTCLECGSELVYGVTFYGHLGHWRCTSCGNRRPVPDIALTKVTAGADATALTIGIARHDDALPPGEMKLRLPLTGLYNAYNALAATAGALALGLPRDAIGPALEGFTAAFGRQERFAIEGRDVAVLLGKNPTGLNQVLRAIAAAEGPKRLLVFLNDGIADGRDVSWIWDADYELVQPRTEWVLAAGTRAEDLALRLKYAGFGEDVPVEHDTGRALSRAVEATPRGGTLYVIPTYTAMLDVRDLLAKRAGGRRFWEDGR